MLSQEASTSYLIDLVQHRLHKRELRRMSESDLLYMSGLLQAGFNDRLSRQQHGVSNLLRMHYDVRQTMILLGYDEPDPLPGERMQAFTDFALTLITFISCGLILIGMGIHMTRYVL